MLEQIDPLQKAKEKVQLHKTATRDVSKDLRGSDDPIPFRALVGQDEYPFIRAGEHPYKSVDITGWREHILREPLTEVDEMLPGKYTPFKWRDHHAKTHQFGGKLLEESDIQRSKCRSTEANTKQRVETAEKEVTIALDGRINDTLEAQSRLKEVINKVTHELQLQNVMKHRLEVSMFTLETPEFTNKECENIRRYRRGVNSTDDPVSHSLRRECEMLRTGRCLVTKTWEETKEQISRLLEVKRLLEHCWSDKQEAFQLDYWAAKLAVKRDLAQYKPVSAVLNEGSSTPVMWVQRIQEHLEVSNRELVSGSQLRGAADQALHEVAKDVLEFGEKVDVALNKRLSELEEAKANLLEKDERVRHEIGQEEMSISSVRQSLQDKESPMQVAESRHWKRSFRPGADRCLDKPHHRLREELEELPRLIQCLREQLKISEDTLEELHRLHETLLNEIQNTEHTISLEKRCILVRSHAPTQLKLQGL